ncbi:1-acyl-sn-glycerol-3-phosphate acyltransferase [Promicromonospora thailandica]|uniref:Acyltransferase n=1 Tax=Promicromonospora thailandica TaxID=765201 RepID=A0A9X2FYM3_9MICO|nr:1-acyl-sn-glycerol-3-phosphate acyltransferase [Promicromonospora thailandica]MCP2263770.1 Acyltransferase [Promicromonospora thailandica]BFF17944.1 1-acyl-sn-glycerol-3-phosphate acyltransferase [Promicromonospora thailandica]
MSRTIRRAVARLIWAVTGYRMRSEPAPTRPTVFIGAPHTSNTDFFLMLAIAFEMDLTIRFLIKDSWFKGPMGAVMRSLGGIPVDRRDPASIVDEVLAAVDRGEEFHLVVTPEGTRGAGSGYWKSGFYRIALKAGLPVTLGYVDGVARVAGLGPSIELTGDVAADMDLIREFYRDKSGVKPKNRTEPRLRSEDGSAV